MRACECTDPGCPVHEGVSSCEGKGRVRLYRIDMDDRSGSLFCRECANDAFDSGVFTNRQAKYAGVY